MAAGTSDSLAGFPFAESRAVPARGNRLEEEVVALFEQLRSPVLRYLLSFRIPVPDAEEVVQDVFLSLYQHLLKDKSRENLQGWIFKVAHNSALKYRLRERQHSTRFVYIDGISEMAPDSNAGPEENAAANQRQQRLLAVVRAMPEQDQCCLWLRAEGLRYREIAEVLGISLGSVASSMQKSLARLTRAEQI